MVVMGGGLMTSNLECVLLQIQLIGLSARLTMNFGYCLWRPQQKMFKLKSQAGLLSRNVTTSILDTVLKLHVFIVMLV